MSLVSPHYVPEPVTTQDYIIASLAFGFTLGFGWLTAWTAIRQTWHGYRKRGCRVFRSPYIIMVWGEIIVCAGFAVMCFLYLLHVIQPCFIYYFGILTLWALQVHFLLQIIINRCAILIHDKRWTRQLKTIVAIVITMVNISVYNIWIPARLQISAEYMWINLWWDRCEKCIYLIIDAALNIYFIVIVQRNLVSNGLTKYKTLVRFNMFIICFSLSMDVLIISMMSLKNTFVYMQFHPLAYMVKLNIEMSMAELIAKVAKQRRLEMWENEDLSNNTTFGNMTQATTTTMTAELSHVSTNRSGRMRKVVDTMLHRSNGSRDSSHAAYTELENQRSHPQHPQRPPSATVFPRHHTGGGDGDGRMGIYTTREVHIEYEANPLHAAAPWMNPPAFSNGALRGRASSFGSPDRNSFGKRY
ncbi:translation initiation factor 2- alpha subunit [Apiospora arundinis]